MSIVQAVEVTRVIATAYAIGNAVVPVLGEQCQIGKLLDDSLQDNNSARPVGSQNFVTLTVGK